MLLLADIDSTIFDKEFALLYVCFQSKNPDFCYESYDKFDLDDMAPADCKAEFRIEKTDLHRLQDVLEMPTVIRCIQRSLCDCLEGLCMLLRQTSYPCLYSDWMPRFPRPVYVLSLITNEVLDFIYENYSHLVTDWNRNVLNAAGLQTYAEAILRKGSPLDNCFGFVDRTVRPIARSDTWQRVVYNRHMRIHGLKFQSHTLPNGLISNIFQPVGELFIDIILSFTITRTQCMEFH